MKERYCFEFSVWNKKLEPCSSECGDELGDYESDDQAILAAEMFIEQKLARGMRKVACLISVRKERYVIERWVKTIQRPESEFKRSPKPTSDSNATQFYPGTSTEKKK